MKRIVLNNIKASGEMTAAEYKSKYGNAMYSLNVDAGAVLIKDCVFGQNGYNCIEIGLATNVEPPKKVDIINCDFTGVLTNNAILVFATQDNAEINIKGCHFASISNMLRISNRTGAKNVVVNIEDCVIDKWESNPMYAGFLLMQDYTSKNISQFNEANPFSKEKLTINVKNLVHAGKRISVENVEAYLNCNSANQLAYIYIGNVPADYRYPAYDPAIFPEINIK